MYWAEMAMDLRLLGIHPDPERLSPRVLSHMHGLAMAAHRRMVAINANAMMRACAAGFGGDKDRQFARFINQLMARPVIRSIEPETETTENVADWDEGKAAAEAIAKKLLNLE